MQSKENDQIFTYQTRLVIDEPIERILDDCAEVFSHIERRLFADLSKGKLAADLKSEYLKKHQITARHFNAIRVQIEGKISSIKEKQAQQIVETGYKIESVNKVIQKLEKKSAFNKLHQKKRLLFNLQQKLRQLKTDQETGKIRLCFGSRRLFRSQFALTANGYQSREEWLKDWRKARNNSFFLIGSKDESSGNQSCTATLSSDGNLSLRIRVPDCLTGKYGKYLLLPNVHFRYGHQEIVSAIKSCETRKQRQKLADPHYKNDGLPISYRYKRDEKGWRLFVSVPVTQPQQITSTQQGVIGIDINANHLAITETDRFGNPLSKETIPLNTYGKSQNQTKALIGNACAHLVTQAKEKGKTLVIENLDFQKKKRQLKEQSSFNARMLSSFAYKSIQNNLKSRAWRNGVQIAKVNPAFTSVIGRVKFSKRYGLSVHHSAALTIGRRCLKFSERVPRHLGFIPDGKDHHVALSLPERNRGKHVWSSWRTINRNLKTVLAAHFRAKKIRSSSSKTTREIKPIPNLTGEIPERESVNTTAQLTCLDLSTFV
jgi:IS605 OrfB family transposase